MFCYIPVILSQRFVISMSFSVANLSHIRALDERALSDTVFEMTFLHLTE